MSPLGLEVEAITKKNNLKEVKKNVYKIKLVIKNKVLMI